MEFNPAFALLAKFNIGLATASKDESDVIETSKYLGVDLPQTNLGDQINFIAKELSAQNGFLSKNLESDSIYSTAEYHKSMFIQEVVANNRENRRNRLKNN